MDKYTSFMKEISPSSDRWDGEAKRPSVLVSKPRGFEIDEFPPGYSVLFDEQRIEGSSYFFGSLSEANRFVGSYARLRHALALLRRQGGFDVVVTGRYGEYFAIIRALSPTLARRPLFIIDIEWKTTHRGRFRRAISRIAHRLIARGSTRLRTYTECEIERYSQHYGIDRGKFVCIPYCSGATAAVADEPGAEPVGIFTGGIQNRDAETLHAALKDFPAPVIVASTADRWPASCLSPNMALTGRVPLDRALAQMRAARLVVVSLKDSTLQSFGVRTYVYAMLLGKCVIVNDPEGASSYIRDGFNGALVPPRNPGALRARVEQLYYDDELRTAIERNARQWAERNCSPSACLNHLEALIGGRSGANGIRS